MRKLACSSGESDSEKKILSMDIKPAAPPGASWASPQKYFVNTLYVCCYQDSINIVYER